MQFVNKETASWCFLACFVLIQNRIQKQCNRIHSDARRELSNVPKELKANQVGIYEHK